MKRFTFLLLLAVLIVSGAGEASQRTAAWDGGSPATAVDAETRDLILEATVRITMIGPRLDETGAPVFVNREGQWTQELILDDGLGTAVLLGKDPVVVTHDHWCMLSPHLLEVRIAAHDGRPLAILSGFSFHQHIRYRDRGTLIFRAPEGVRAKAAVVADDALNAADQVLLARIRPTGGHIDVVPARVVGVKEGPSPQTARLRTGPDLEITYGSSGGGVWSGKLLAGNLWSVVNQVTSGDGTLPGDRSATTDSYAALLPCDLFSGS